MSETPSTSLDQLLAAAEQSDEGWRHHIGPDWMQGRTAYGGLSAALTLDAALRDHPGDAPLRTAQVSFIGPVGGETQTATRLLRQSKSSRFVAADLTSEAGYGTAATFSFMSARQSHIDFARTPPPIAAPPSALRSLPEHPARPAFTRKFDMRPASGSGDGFGHAADDADIITWVRWMEEPACDVHIALLALADALPPAAIRLFNQFGPLSSSTWIMHFLNDAPQTDDGWWLLASRSTQVQRGFSAQTMEIWNHARELVAVGQQGVALYV